MGWNNDLACLWTKMVGPSRPTVSELTVYSKYAHALMEKKKRRLKLLVLGSTPEFRDWGFEENMEVWVMDANLDYHNTINREIRHKCIIDSEHYKESVVCGFWQDMDFIDEFDIIIGDLAIGNIPPERLEEFISKVKTALTKDGMFLGKSFFVPDDYKKVDFKELMKDYYNGAPYNPYSFLAFHLTMHCLDENNMLNFKKQYDFLQELHKQGIVKKETLTYFENVGWDTAMKFGFHCPKQSDYKHLLEKYLFIETTEYGQDIYSPYFPLYIATKK